MTIGEFCKSTPFMLESKLMRMLFYQPMHYILWFLEVLLLFQLTTSFCVSGHFNKTLQTTQQLKTLKSAAKYLHVGLTV